jgi:hypothetical protein
MAQLPARASIEITSESSGSQRAAQAKLSQPVQVLSRHQQSDDLEWTYLRFEKNRRHTNAPSVSQFKRSNRGDQQFGAADGTSTNASTCLASPTEAW